MSASQIESELRRIQTNLAEKIDLDEELLQLARASGIDPSKYAVLESQLSALRERLRGINDRLAELKAACLN